MNRAGVVHLIGVASVAGRELHIETVIAFTVASTQLAVEFAQVAIGTVQAFSRM